MHIECMVMHDVQNESLVFLYQLGTLSPLPSGEKEVSQTPHCKWTTATLNSNYEFLTPRNYLRRDPKNTLLYIHYGISQK